MTTEQAAILEAIRALPREARVGLVEQVMRELATDPMGGGESVIGLFADEPDLIEEVSCGAMQAREQHPARLGET